MRFIVDAQLPAALARFLENYGHDAKHVFDIGLANAEDKIMGSDQKQEIVLHILCLFLVSYRFN